MGKKRKGFTLVELLIVIIIIGILAGAMLLVAGSSTDKAEATRIVSDLRTLKSAIMMAYSDKGTWPSSSTLDEVKPYLGGNNSIDTTKYELVENSSSGAVYVGCKSIPSKGVKTKLKDMADKDKNLFGDTAGTLYDGNAEKVYMQVR